MKLRRIVYDEDDKINKVVWFGSKGTTAEKDGRKLAVKEDNYLKVDPYDIESIKEQKRMEIIIALSTIKGEIKDNPKFGFGGLINKSSKEMMDIEITNLLRNDLGLLITKFESTQEDRKYKLYFEATTYDGVEINMTYSYGV
jgi:hypothetical protein